MRAWSRMRLVPAPAGLGVTVRIAGSHTTGEVSPCVSVQATRSQHAAQARRPCMQMCMAETWLVHA